MVGNEDGAHHCHAELYQALNDVGFTIPAGAGTYWVGEAMGSVDYKDLKEPYDKTAQTTGCWRSTPRIWRSFWKANPYPGMDKA